MIRNEYVKYIIGFAVGILITSWINAVQPRHISVTIDGPVKSQLEITPLSLEALK
jgi:hypothetical protein